MKRSLSFFLLWIFVLLYRAYSIDMSDLPEEHPPSSQDQQSFSQTQESLAQKSPAQESLNRALISLAQEEISLAKAQESLAHAYTGMLLTSYDKKIQPLLFKIASDSLKLAEDRLQYLYQALEHQWEPKKTNAQEKKFSKREKKITKLENKVLKYELALQKVHQKRHANRIKSYPPGWESLLMGQRNAQGNKHGLWFERRYATEQWNYDEVIVGQYSNGKKVGYFNIYDEQDDGSLKYTLEQFFYGNHPDHAAFLFYYDDGNLEQINERTNGITHGIFKSFYSNGSLKQINERTNGIIHGIFKSFYSNGSLKHIDLRRHGVNHGLKKKYWDNGALFYKYLQYGNLISQEILFYDRKEKLIGRMDYLYDDLSLETSFTYWTLNSKGEEVSKKTFGPMNFLKIRSYRNTYLIEPIESGGASSLQLQLN